MLMPCHLAEFNLLYVLIDNIFLYVSAAFVTDKFSN